MKYQRQLPLLHDHHSHISLYASLASCPDISALTAAEARSYLARLPSDRLSVVRGWRSSSLVLSAEELAQLPPVLLINFSLHGFLISDSGLPYLASIAPVLAERRLDAQWLEANVPQLFETYCELAGLDGYKLVSFLDRLEELGIGSTEDLCVSSPAALATLSASAPGTQLDCWASPDLYARLDDPSRKLCSGIKLFLDGALGARSAAIRGRWIGAGTGIFPYSLESLEREVQQAVSWNTGLAMHAIGELAIDLALDATERVLRGGARCLLCAWSMSSL